MWQGKRSPESSHTEDVKWVKKIWNGRSHSICLCIYLNASLSTFGLDSRRAKNTARVQQGTSLNINHLSHISLIQFENSKNTWEYRIVNVLCETWTKPQDKRCSFFFIQTLSERSSFRLNILIFFSCLWIYKLNLFALLWC